MSLMVSLRMVTACTSRTLCCMCGPVHLLRAKVQSHIQLLGGPLLGASRRHSARSFLYMLCGRADGQSHVGPSLVFPPPAYMLRAMSIARDLCFLSVCSLILHGHSTKKCPLPCKPRVCVCSSVVSHSCNSYMRFLLQQAFSWKDLDV